LYGPPIFRPDLLIVGRNPGFNADDLYDDEIRTWPLKNEYTNRHWPLAKKIRSIFSDAGLETLLDSSLGTNQLFFKSKVIGRHQTGLGWGDNPINVRKKLEAYCARELASLVQFLEPRTILTLGLSVFDDLADDDRRDVVSGKERRLASIGAGFGGRMVGIIHPTGAQVSNVDWDQVARELSVVLGKDEQFSYENTAMPKKKKCKPVPVEWHSSKKPSSRQPPFRPDTVVRAANKPAATFGYQPIHDFWQELSRLGDISVQDFHTHMITKGWRRPQGGKLTYDVTRTDVACMCREGFATRVSN